MTAQRICALADTLGLPLTLPEIDCILLEVSSGHYDATMQLLTKTPVSASSEEIAINPRARSAKLRAAVKNKKEREAHANTG